MVILPLSSCAKFRLRWRESCPLTSHIVNELSNSIDLESTLIRAEALFRRFQRKVDAIDKKSNFPAPKLRHRQPARNSSTSSADLAHSPLSPDNTTSPTSTTGRANTSGTDTVTVGGVNSGGTNSAHGSRAGSAVDKGKGKNTEDSRKSNESQTPAPSPKVISPELRQLLSRKVDVLPRKLVKKEGEGRSSLGE
jgi:hypothetical protein